MKTKSLLKACATLTGSLTAISGVVYYEIMGRNAKLYEKFEKVFSAQPDGDALLKEENDERYVWFRSQKFKTFEITNADGKRLCAHLLEADTKSDVFVLCSHGYRCDGRGEFRFTAKYYHEKGFNVFMVDHIASGDSEGGLISFGYYESRDLLKWIDFLKESFGENISIILHGVSMGSATVTMASGSEKLPDNVKFTVADCGYTSMEDQFRAVLKSNKIPSFPLIQLTNLWCRLIGKFAYKDVSPIEAVKNARVPMLFIHGADDDFVPTAMVYRLYDACTSQKDLLLVDGAAHARSCYVNGELYNKKIDEFIEKYLSREYTAG